jgi:hypothetical protein
MLSIKRRRFFLNIVEVFFTNPDKYNYEENSGDILLIIQSSVKGENSKKYNTLHVDLRKNVDILKSELRKNTRNEISRCIRKDELIVTITDQPTLLQLDDFIDFYNKFSRVKKIPSANKDKLISLHNVKGLALGMIKDLAGNFLVMHAYIISKNRARLLYSSSLHVDPYNSQTKSLIGRANRMLHWDEIVFYKRKLYDIYDFGGLSLSDSVALSQIDNFKLGFGGKVVVEYNDRIGVSMLGKIFLFIHKILNV